MANTEVGAAYVTIFPQTDGNFSKQVGRQIGDGVGGGISSKAVAMGNIMSSALSTAANVAVGAVKDIVGGAFEGFADYEQLAGGVEKIFDQADIGKIMGDANEAYRELNMSANEYLASINQTGAAFAQTMGDQKGYDTARTGMLAIADYASGTGRNLDELNEKYAMITRATSSYQSIADQFSGILPATSADFLEQAQAAGFLGESYSKLTEVPVAEYQEAVTKMLEKGVADMGLAGNTARESTETISGSLAMVQKSWDNMLAGLMNEDADIGQLVDNLVRSLGTAAGVIAPKIAELVANVVQELPGALASALQGSGDMLSGIFEQMFGGPMPELPINVGAFAETFRQLGESVGQAFGELPQLDVQGFATVVANVVNAVQPLLQALIPVFAGIASGIGSYLSYVIERFNAAVSFVNNVVTPVASAVYNAVMPVVQEIASTVGAVITEVTSVFGDSASNLSSMAQSTFPAMASTVRAAMNAVKAVVTPVWNAVRSVVSSVCGSVRSIVGAAWPTIQNVVKTASDGIKTAITGIKSVVSSVRSTFNSIKQAMADPINKAKDTVKGVLDRIRGFFPLSIGHVFSNLSLPSIHVNGGSPPFGIGGQGSLPSFSVSWNAKGAFFDDPTLIGVGERGAEMLLPKRGQMMDDFAEVLSGKMGAQQGDGRPNVYVGDITVTPQSALYDLLMELGETMLADRRRGGKAVA